MSFTAASAAELSPPALSHRCGIVAGMRYRKKPVEIEAIQYTGSNADVIREFTSGLFSVLDADNRAVEPGAITAEVFDVLHSTWVLVHDGDWIIKGIKGEFYPIANDVFRETYEAVD